MMKTNGSKYRDRQIIVLSLLFVPVAFAHNYFHEFGHWLTGEVLGYDMGIGLNGVWLEKGNYTSEKHCLYVGMGGPAFSVLLSLIFMLLIETFKSAYAYPLVFFPLYSRFFALNLGNFKKQDEAYISSALNLGTYTVAIIVIVILLLIAWRSIYKLRFGFKQVGIFFLAATVSKFLEIGVIELLR